MKTGEVCVANIGPQQRHRRLKIGLGALMAGTILVAGLTIADAPRAWHIVVIAPFWVAALCLAEARARTCVVLAARKARNLDDGEEAITDPADLRHIAAQARAVHVQAALLAAALTGAVVALAP